MDVRSIPVVLLCWCSYLPSIFLGDFPGLARLQPRYAQASRGGGGNREQQETGPRSPEPAGRIPAIGVARWSPSMTSPSPSTRGEVLGVVGESGAGKSMTGSCRYRAAGTSRPDCRRRSPARRGNASTICRPRRCAGCAASVSAWSSRTLLTSLNPLYTVGRPADRDDPDPSERLRQQGPQAGDRPSGGSGHSRPGKAHRPVSAPVLGRHAARRVVIALALCVNPRMIIADEPTTALDVSIQAQIIKLSQASVQGSRRRRLMLITHDMGVIAETADRVAVIVCRAHRRDRAGQGRHQACQAPLYGGADGLDSRRRA